jgi:hypothetical protein
MGPMADTLMLPGEPVLNLRIGRDTTCDVVLAHRSVSRLHALVNGSPDRWWITDGGSRNGSWVNGERAFPGVSRPLRLGDVVRLGELELVAASTGDPVADADPTTDVVISSAGLAALSPYQMQVVRALCTECRGGAGHVSSNAEIAAQLGTPQAVGAVKAALRRVYARVGLAAEDNADKRRALCRIAHEGGWLGPGVAGRHPGDHSG